MLTSNNKNLKQYIKEYLKVYIFKKNNNLLEQDGEQDGEKDDDEENKKKDIIEPNKTSLNIDLNKTQDSTEKQSEPELQTQTNPETEKDNLKEPTTNNDPNKPIEINIDQAAALIRGTRGKIFTVIFTKKDGEERVLNGRLGVKKYLRGGSLRYNPNDHGLIPVYDIGSSGYRMINISGIKALKIRGYIFKVK